MDHEVDVVGEFKPDDLQQVAGVVGSDGEDLGRIGFVVEIDDSDGMVEGVEDGGIVDTVLAGRPVDLHITILYYAIERNGTSPAVASSS